MLWDADPLNEQGRFSLELSSRCRESDLPLSLSFLAKRDTRIALPEESEDWVRSRIVPEDRHNIVEVLLANGLAEYNEVSNCVSAETVAAVDAACDFTGCEQTRNDIAVNVKNFCACVDVNAAHAVVDARSDLDCVVRGQKRCVLCLCRPS